MVDTYDDIAEAIGLAQTSPDNDSRMRLSFEPNDAADQGVDGSRRSRSVMTADAAALARLAPGGVKHPEVLGQARCGGVLNHLEAGIVQWHRRLGAPDQRSARILRSSASISAALSKRLSRLDAHAFRRKSASASSEVWADALGVDDRLVDHRLRARIRMLAVAEQLVEHHADREEVGRHVPAGEVGVGRLVRRRARLRVHRVADARRDVEVEQLRARSA